MIKNISKFKQSLKPIYKYLFIGLHFQLLFCNTYPSEKQLEMVKYFIPAPIDENQLTGLEGVDAIYCINLETRPEKFQKCEEQFNLFNLFVNRFNAINGWQAQYYLPDFFGTGYQLSTWQLVTLTPGAIACSLSHLSIIQDAYNRGLKLIWIMEDDLAFVNNPHLLPPILEKLSRIDPEWDIYYTDPEHTKPCTLRTLAHAARPEIRENIASRLIPRKIIDDDIMTTGLRFGTRSYLLSRRGMKKILNHFTTAYWYGPIDIELHLIEGIREYSCPYKIVSVGTREISDTKFAPDKI